MKDLRKRQRAAPGLFTLPVRAWMCPKCGASSPPELGIDQDTAAALLEACKAIIDGGWLADETGHTPDGSTPVTDQLEAAIARATKGET